jgi:hypothetical protein
MEQKVGQRPWRLELNNPFSPPIFEWRTVVEFDDAQLVPFQGLRDELNQRYSPVQLRIVPNSVEYM